MKRILIITITTFLFLFSYTVFASNNKYNYLNLTKEELHYIEENNIDIDNLINYYHYQSFDLYKYFEYEKVRKDNHSYLEAINIINNPNYYSNYDNFEKALFRNSSSILINKHYFVEKNYLPNNLVKLQDYPINYIKRENEVMLASSIALENLIEMFNDAKKEDIDLYVFSAYRDYLKQEYLYYIVNQQNDNYSARPGHSEHHSGLAFDISTPDVGLTLHFEKTKGYDWLVNNCYRYGFILRYPKNKENITLYKFEPWHFRYVGKDIALNIHNNSLSLEEYILKNYELN